MNVTVALPEMPIFRETPSLDRKERFRNKFQRSLRACIKRGFSVEESFGMIWVETWEDVSLTEQEQSELYGELINWAKKEAFGKAY